MYYTTFFAFSQASVPANRVFWGFSDAICAENLTNLVICGACGSFLGAFGHAGQVRVLGVKDVGASIARPLNAHPSTAPIHAIITTPKQKTARFKTGGFVPVS